METHTSEIFYSKEVLVFFEDLFLSNFSKEKLSEINSRPEVRAVLNAEVDEFANFLSKDEEIDENVKREALKELGKSTQSTYNYERLNNLLIHENILNKYFISSVPIPSYIQAFTALQIGYSIGINRGISANLSSKPSLFNMVKKVWQICIKDVHPFQRGDTNQGTRHSMTIVNYLNKLSKRITNPGLDEAVILLVSAAVHDIGKALLLDSDHAVEGYLFTKDKNNSSLLGIEDKWRDRVCTIIQYHTGKKLLTTISSPDLQTIAAIFMLCDVSDMTHTRISDVIFSLNENKLKSSTHPDKTKFYDKLFTRKNIDKLLLRTDYFDAIVTSKDGLNELGKIKDSVRYDNNCLASSEARKILAGAGSNLPTEFRVNGTTP